MDNAKDRFCSSLDPISLYLKLTRLPANFLMKTHQKKLLHRVESRVCLGGALKRKERDPNEDDEKFRSASKVDPIPFELEVEILTRLPANSLMKFQCVSKMWSTMIRSQRFVDSYYAMSSTMRSQFRITLSNGAFAEDHDKRLLIFSSSYEKEESSSLVANLDMTIPSMTLAYLLSKCPSVHGFFGFCNDLEFIVCNPSTGQIITLPVKGCRTSLGYDPVENRFKALTYVRNHISYLEYEVTTLGGGESPWRRNKVTSPPFFHLTKDLCINGFVYWGAWEPRTIPVIVCFDVRYERLSFIQTPKDVLLWESKSILIEYKGKLASIARIPHTLFHSFDLWILEDVKKHDWSKQTCKLPFSFKNMTSPGTNKAGEIIFAPTSRSYNIMTQPLYIFYYNVERKDTRIVRLQGIADDEEFRRHYGLKANCFVSISPEHVESIASL